MTKEQLELEKKSLEDELNSHIDQLSEILRISKNAGEYLQKEKSTFKEQIGKVTTIESVCREGVSCLKQSIKKLEKTRIEEYSDGKFQFVYDSDEDVRFMEKRTYRIEEESRDCKYQFYSYMNRIYFYTRKKGR